MKYIPEHMTRLNFFKTVEETDLYKIQIASKGPLAGNRFVLFCKEDCLFAGDEQGFYCFDNQEDAKNLALELERRYFEQEKEDFDFE